MACRSSDGQTKNVTQRTVRSDSFDQQGQPPAKRILITVSFQLQRSFVQSVLIGRTPSKVANIEDSKESNERLKFGYLSRTLEESI